MKIVRRLVTWLLAISMILGSLVTDAVTAYAAEPYTLTETASEISAKLYKGEYDNDNESSNQEVSSGDALDYGDTVTFRLTWTLPNTLGITSADTFTYTIPNNLHFEDLKGDGNLIGSSGGKIGTYTIKGNVFTFKYLDSYLETTKSDNNRKGYANLETEITKADTNDQNGGDVNWSFPGGSSYTCHINEDTSDYKLEVSKTSKDATTNKTSLTDRPFEITVEAKGADHKNVTVADTLGKYLSVKGGIEKSSFNITDESNNSISDYELKSTDNGFEIVFAEMAKGAKYTISYSADIDKSVLNGQNQIWAGNNPDNGLTNSVSVTSNYQTSPKKKDATPQIEKQWLSKSGSKNSDGNIDWTIVVNVSGVAADLEGAVIKDTLGSSPAQSYVPDSFSVTPGDSAVEGLTFDTLQSGFTFKTSTTATYTIK